MLQLQFTKDEYAKLDAAADEAITLAAALPDVRAKGVDDVCEIVCKVIPILEAIASAVCWIPVVNKFCAPLKAAIKVLKGICSC